MIELTTIGGKRLLVNTNNIQVVREQRNDPIMISFGEGCEWFVAESFDDIKAMIGLEETKQDN